MKPFLFATFTAMIVTLISAQMVSSAEASTGPLSAIAEVVHRIDGLHTDYVDGSLVVVDEASGASICVLTSEQDGVVAIVAGGALRGVVDGLGEVDMPYLDTAAVGVLVVDRARSRWSLTHRFDSRRASVAQIEDLVARFSSAAAAMRTRFDLELSLVR
jgi:hypothetical protein